jgi:hypothetical protein
VSYRAYWTDAIFAYLNQHTGSEISLQKLSEKSGISLYDIIRLAWWLFYLLG